MKSQIPIALVGAVCRFPGADSCQTFWSNIRQEKSFLNPPPNGRWKEQTPYIGGFLEDIDGFDAEKFKISPREARVMDPQQRLMLTLADEARTLVPNIDTHSIGVFVGAGHPSYIETLLKSLGPDAPKELLPGNLLSLISARISYVFDLHGPAMTIDCACASSLVALHQACQALSSGECEAAYVGGVHLNVTPLVFRLFEIAGVLSPTGYLNPFSTDGDGTVLADGAGMIILEPLERAQKFGHPIWATIIGSAINNCGRTMGIMTPKRSRQIAVIQEALQVSGINSEQVGFVQAHTTGTKIGDATESRTIQAAYPHKPRVGAVKKYIGHSLTASGMASLIATLGELQNTEIGGINSFGFGGTNVHVLIAGGDVPQEQPVLSSSKNTGDNIFRLGEKDAEPDLSSWVFSVEKDAQDRIMYGGVTPGPDPFIRGGNYLLTGASGGIGGEIAQYLARTYHAKLFLVGRRKAEGKWKKTLDELKQHAAEVWYLSADLTTPSDTRRIIEEVRTHFTTVDGLFHIAGVIDEKFAMAVKRDGLLALESLHPRLTVLFSSISALMPGVTSQLKAYAEANQWLDDYARAEHRKGRKIISLSWAPWARVGMAARVSEEYRKRGLDPIEPELAVLAMQYAVSSGLPHVAIFHRKYVHSSKSITSKTMDIQEHVYAVIQKYTDVPSDQLQGDQHLMTLGVDSLLALDIVKELEMLLGCSIPTTFLFEYDTLDAMIEGLKEIQGTSQGSTASPRANVLSPVQPSERVSLLDSQKTFLVHQQFFPEVPCNTFLACRVETPNSQPLQEDEVRVAVQVLTQRHPVLRSVVTRDEGQWFLLYGTNMPEVHWVDFLDDEKVANTVLDLERGPLLHVFTDGKRLAIQGHHLLVDAWSAKLLMEELLLLVQSKRSNKSIDTSPILPDWQKAAALLRDNDSSETESDFWKGRLHRLPPLPLPWDGDPSAPPTGPAHMLIRRCSRKLTRNVEDMSRRDSVTMAAIVLASYAQLLFDRSGQHDLLIRVAHARRDIRLQGIEHIIGSFADSFPVRIALRPQETPSSLAKRVHRELIAVRKHSGVSSISLAQQKERSMAGPEGLTPAGFSFVNFDSSPNIGEFKIRDVVGGSASGFTRLGLIGFVFENRLCFSFNFLHSHFHSETVSDFAQHLEKILDNWVKPSYTMETQGRLDGEIVAACERYGRKQLMPGLSFHELSVSSHALASKLQTQLNVPQKSNLSTSGSRVALFADPGIAGTLGIVGILRSGAAYVPLDPSWPDVRIETILREADVSGIVVAPECVTRAASLAQGLPLIVADVASLSAISPAPLHPALNTDAYMMFTSGSTGRPKGARVSHQAVLTLLNWVQRMLQIREDDCFSQSSSLAFGASLRQTFSPILSGASAVSPDTDTKKDPHALLDFLETHQVTVFNSVPSVWTFLMDALQHRHSTASIFSLRWVLIGGEGIPSAYVTRWQKLFPSGPRLVNLYGAAETIANVAWFEVPPNFVAESAFLPIGWPRFGMHVHLENILDGTGEMIISGPIAEGYHRPEDKGFDMDNQRNVRSFRSGDQAFYNAAGALVCVGRKDNQIKIHGHRVEVGEIEATLCEFSGIQAARIEYADGYMTAHIEAQSGKELQEDEIRVFLTQRLAAHMIPNAIVMIKALERTAIGKIARTHSKTTASNLEIHLGGIWKELLRLSEPPQGNSDFFALGGDSMLAIEMAMRFEEVGGQRISPLLIHTHRRFGQLLSILELPPTKPASSISKGEPVISNHSESAAARISPTPSLDENSDSPSEISEEPLSPKLPPPISSKTFRLGPVQRGFWLASQGEQEPLWTIRLPLKGALQWEGFQAAVRWIQERHPILRTEFTVENHKPRQRPGTGPWIPVQFDDLSVFPEDLRKSALEQRFAEELSVRLSVKKEGWLVRMKLCRLNQDMHVLFVTGHHILTDAHSAWVLLAELFQYHDNAWAGKPLPAAVPETKYLEVLSIPQQSADPFWPDYLKDLPPHISAESSERVHQACHFELSVDELSQLRTAASSRNTSPFGLVFLAAGKAFLDVLNEDDIVLATAISGRDWNTEAWNDAVGPFAYGIPVRINSPLENNILENLRNALSHASSALDTLPGMLGVEGVSALGRYFISWLETSASAKIPQSTLVPQWPEADLRFHAQSTATDISISVLAHEGLSVHVRGTGPIESFAESMERMLKNLIKPRSALIIYAPKDVHIPFHSPLVVETVSSAWGTTDLVLLPLHEGQLGETTLLRKCIREAIDLVPARTVALAGMLPSLTGLGTETLSGRNVVLSTGHAATVVAMFKTVQTVLTATEKAWNDLHIGVLGFGAIGQATLQLCVAKLGKPQAVSIADPRFGTSVSSLLECDMILGATSTGLVLDVGHLKPGTIVIDDSFPRAFDDQKAWQRMEQSQDVLLLGGGMLDVGYLERTSPLPQAAAVRSQYPTQWLPGCHAEALLLTVRSELGPTVGPVDLRRSLQVLEAVDALGWKAAPLHLGPKEVNLQCYVNC